MKMAIQEEIGSIWVIGTITKCLVHRLRFTPKFNETSVGSCREDVCTHRIIQPENICLLANVLRSGTHEFVFAMR